MNKTQNGVALVQVLLITAMILILVIQLSKDARQQLKTSQINKDKVVALIAMRNAVEKKKFELLSQRNINGKLFFGQPQATSDTVLKVQDVAGRLSLSYGHEQIAQFLGIKTTDPKIVALLSWQGLSDKQNIEGDREKRGLIQYPKEIASIPGWTLNKELEDVVTVIPTKYFNPLSASTSTLERLYGVEVASDVEALRKRNNVVQAQNLFRNGNLDAVTEPSNVFQLVVEKNISGVTITRAQLIQINPDSGLVIQVLEY